MLRSYRFSTRSVGYSNECLGFHLGTLQTANLGDGQGPQNETAVVRADFGSSLLGTCLESLTGAYGLFRAMKTPTIVNGLLISICLFAIRGRSLQNLAAGDYWSLVSRGFQRGAIHTAS